MQLYEKDHKTEGVLHAISAKRDLDEAPSAYKDIDTIMSMTSCINPYLMSKNHRSGKKIGGRHTTLIDAAEEVVDFLVSLPEVTSVMPGFITSGIKTGKRRIKVMEEKGSLLVKVRGSISVQEIRVFSKDLKRVQDGVRKKFDIME